MSVLREYIGVALVVLSLGLSTGVSLPPCVDFVKEGGCHSLQNICSDILASTLCPNYCGFCHKAATKPVDTCIDHDKICSTMADVCSNPIGPALCGKTCHTCVTAVTKPVDTCTDHDPICSTMSDVCRNPLGPALCGKTCHTCVTAGRTMITAPATSSTTSTPSTTAAVTTAPATTSTASTATSAPSPTAAVTTAPATTSTVTTTSSTPSPTADVTTAPATTSTVTTTTSTPSTTAAVTTAPTTTSPSTAKAIQRSCYKCGDVNTGTLCTIMETIVPKASPCPSDAGFCMTDLFQHTDGSTKYIRRCVDEGACKRQWYEQTSDNSECVDVDPTTLTSDITCRYCCTTDNCNSGNMPVRNTLYKPKH